MDEEPRVTATFAITGRFDHVQTIEFLLGWIAQCGIEGTTRIAQLMVDGDGGGRVEVMRDGNPLVLSEEAQTFAMEAGTKLPPSLEAVGAEWGKGANDEAVLRVDLA